MNSRQARLGETRATHTHRTVRATAWLWAALAATLVAAVALPAGAQTTGMPEGMAYFAGPITGMDGMSVTIQGARLALGSQAVYVGEDSSGNLQTLTPADFQVGDTVSAFETNNSGTPTLTSLYRGLTFMVQGQVTAIQNDSQGNPQTVTVDGVYAINVSRALFDGMSSSDMGSGMGGNLTGGMGSGGMMGGGGMGGGGMVKESTTVSNTQLLQVGSYAAFGGIVSNGLYAAVFAHVMANGMMGNGSIQGLMHDSSGNVSGFTMGKGGSNTNVVMNGATQITRKGQMMSANSLSTGMKVKVQGLTRTDGSMLAQSITVKGKGGGMM